MSDETLRRLTNYAEKLRFEDLPPETVHQVKRLMVDSLGCAIGAYTSEPAKAARGLAASVTGKRTATLIGTRDRTTPEAIEGEFGWFAALARRKLTVEPLTGENGHPRAFRIMNSRIKRFPSGFFSQTAIEAALDCRQALGITSARQVKAVRIRTFQNTINAMAGDATRWRPQTRETADHSVPFVTAMALEHGRVEASQFVDEVLQDPSVHAAMDKVKVELDPECEAAWPDAILNIVTVETDDGRTHTARVP